MDNHEKLVTLCTQITEATLPRNEDASECYCPFCESISDYSSEISSIRHEKNCAYLIAAKLLEQNEKYDIRVAYAVKNTNTFIIKSEEPV